ncbi:hypothetical protein D3C83_134010 [compost metagenome]
MIAGLRRPPPQTSHSRAGAGKWRVAAATAAAVISVSVAAPSAGARPSGMVARKSSRSSDLGGIRAK